MKFYGIDDLSTSYYYSYVINFIDKYKNERLKNINDYLLLYNVVNYTSEIKLDIEEQKIENFLKDSNKKLGEYFGRLRINNINFEYNDIDNQYKDDFWKCCSNYNNLNKVPAEAFKDFIIDNDVSMYLILKHKKIVNRYNNVIKEILLEKPKYFKFFIKYYSDEQTSIYLPNNFTEEEVDKWANRYINSPNPNFNYIEKLSKWSNHHAFKLKDQIILKAKKTYNNQTKTIMKEGTSSQFIIQVKLVEKFDTIIHYKLDGANPTITINKNFLLNHANYKEILYIVFNIFRLSN